MMSENTDYLDYICRRLHWHDNPVEVFNETLEDGRHVFGKERRADTGDLVGIWTDISELKKAEDNIRKSSEQVKRMLEASPTPIVIRNLKDRTILYFNQNAARYYQSMRNPIVIGTTDTLFDLSQVKPLVSEFLEKGKIFNKEVQFTAPDGETVPLIYSATIVSYEHQPAAMYLVELALDLGTQVLKPGGNFVAKVFQGEGFDEYFQLLRDNFQKVITRKPDSSRARSREVYLLGKGFKGSSS